MASFDIVLVTWNSARWLPASLPSFSALEGHARVIVVDNDSEDESVAIVRSLLPDATLLVNEWNEGFAAAANRGIAKTTADFVLVVNPDLRLAPDYGVRLIDRLEARGEEWGAATGRLHGAAGDAIEPTGVIDSDGIEFTRSGRHFDIRQGVPAAQADTRDEEVFGVSGAAAMYRRTFIDDLSTCGSFFDERFFAYREDADVAWRGRIFGWRAVCDPAAEGWHVRRVTPAARARLPHAINMHSVKNRFLLRINNQGMRLALLHLPFQLARDLVVLGAVIARERTSLPGLRWLWNNRRQAWERRTCIQSKRRVGDRDIAPWFR